jgi:hypothetical protein
MLLNALDLLNHATHYGQLTKPPSAVHIMDDLKESSYMRIPFIDHLNGEVTLHWLDRLDAAKVTIN